MASHLLWCLRLHNADTVIQFSVSVVTKGTAPSDTPGGDTRMKLIVFVGEFRKNSGQTMSEGGSGDETTGKKGKQFAEK